MTTLRADELSTADNDSVFTASKAPVITLSDQQEEAAASVLDWWDKRDRPYFYLAGYAGVGKTSIAKEIVKRINVAARYCCYTGKAAKVLTSKGCPASTIHSLIYLPTGEIDEEIEKLEKELHDVENPPTDVRERKIIKRLGELRAPSFVLRSAMELEAVDLLVIDEVSMCDAAMANDLMSFNKPILVLGDPGQLPPIRGEGYFTSKEPDFMLTEIHRQAADSPVLQLATKARKMEKIFSGEYGDSKVMGKAKMGKDDVLGVSQVLVGSNKARRSITDEMRTLLGFSGTFPKAGEKLICLRNSKFVRILNGQMFVAASDYDEEDCSIKLTDEDGFTRNFYIHRECFTRPEVVQSWDYKKRSQMQEFDFANAITIHKSQGSQWDSVLVYPDLFSWDREKYAQLLYTGITRAAKRVIVAL